METEKRKKKNVNVKSKSQATFVQLKQERSLQVGGLTKVKVISSSSSSSSQFLLVEKKFSLTVRLSSSLKNGPCSKFPYNDTHTKPALEGLQGGNKEKE